MLAGGVYAERFRACVWCSSLKSWCRKLRALSHPSLEAVDRVVRLWAHGNLTSRMSRLCRLAALEQAGSKIPEALLQPLLSISLGMGLCKTVWQPAPSSLQDLKLITQPCESLICPRSSFGQRRGRLPPGLGRQKPLQKSSELRLQDAAQCLRMRGAHRQGA